METNRRMLEGWNAASDHYDSQLEQNRYYYFVSDWIAKHAREIGSLTEPRVLDLGCGTGLNISLLREQYPGVRAVGVDISPRMLERARALEFYEKLHSHDLDSPLPELVSDSFDLVIAFGFFEFLYDAFCCLSECKRVLKSGGTLWATFQRFEAEDVASPPRHTCISGIQTRGYAAAEILHMVNRLELRLNSLEPAIAYITHHGFGCPYYVLRAQKEA